MIRYRLMKGFTKLVLLLFFLLVALTAYLIYKLISGGIEIYDQKREEIAGGIDRIVERIRTEGEKGLEFAQKALEDLKMPEKFKALEKMLQDTYSKVRDFTKEQLDKLKGDEEVKDSGDKGKDAEKVPVIPI